MIIKCSKCGRPAAITYFHTAKIELCLDCSIEAMNLIKAEFPSCKKFVERWTEANEEQAEGRMNRK